MERQYSTELHFEKKDFTETPLAAGEYEQCTFTGCNFSGVDLSYFVFGECKFDGCNLSSAKLAKTTFREASFTSCKLLGLHFSDCDDFLFTVMFQDCILELSSFYKRKMKKTHFKNCSLREVDFTEADLTASLFDQCDLANAVFDNTILEKADFRTAINYALDPENNRIKKAKFSIHGVGGLLHKYDIQID